MFGIKIRLLVLIFSVMPLLVVAAPIPIKVVVVSMFEHGEITGDRPGEFQFWAERLPMEKRISFPAGEFDLRLNDDGVLGICTGGGIPNATASVIALKTGCDDGAIGTSSPMSSSAQWNSWVVRQRWHPGRG